jgi:uncharacterized protein YprB with RNaseH-like and TPR domain
MKILYLDIETTPNRADVWGLWNQTVSLTQLRESSRLMCFAAKWDGEERTHFLSEWTDGAYMIDVAHEMLGEADVVVHYNGKKFDIPVLYKEFVLAELDPPAPFQEIDLLNVVRKRFRFPSNKLDYVATALLGEGKVKHSGHELWVRCMAGDPKAHREMERYNRQDVILLEDLYYRVLSWIPSHPHRGLYMDAIGDVCSNCGSDDLRREGFAYTTVGKFQRYQCRACGTWSRSGKRELGAGARGTK